MPKGPKGEKRPADVIGGAIIFAASTYIAIRESRLARERARSS